MGASNTSFDRTLQETLDSFFVKLRDLMHARQYSLEEFQRLYPQWLEARNETINGFCRLIEKGLEIDKNVNITSFGGSSVSLLSGAACIGGLVLAPFTAGLSTLATVGGIFGTTAGSITSAGARVTGLGLSLIIQKEAATLLEKDCQETSLISTLIEESSMSLENIFSFINKNTGLLRQLQRNNCFSNIDPTVRMAISRISNDTAKTRDYHIVLFFICSEQYMQLQGLRKISPQIESFESPVRLYVSLRRSVGNIKTCITLLKNLKAGTSTVAVAGKLARLGKGALIGISMLADIYDIGCTAESMLKDEVPDYIMKLQVLLGTLETQKGELAQFFQQVRAT